MKACLTIPAISLYLLLCSAAQAASSPTKLPAAAIQRANAAVRSATDATRYPDAPDLKAMLPRFLTQQGFLDPEFSAAANRPSKYYTDFYGAQALANVTTAEIKRDFVPKYAEIAGEDAHSITLKFKSGYTGRFYPHSALVIKGIQIPFDHVYISGTAWRELLTNLHDFLGIIQANGWQSRYLVPNPQYKAEMIVAARIADGGWPAPALTVDPELKAFDASDNAVLIAPEGVHGIPSTGFDKLDPLLKTHPFDWLGMEMLPSSMQTDLDIFTQGKEGSPAYISARKAIIHYFANAWNGQAGPKTTGEENYYFKLVDTMRRKHGRVIGMEGASLTYDAFRYGESAFGAEVRSYLWSLVVPTHGRGAVYGGSAHFTSPRPVNFQNFLEERNPTVKFFLLKLLHVISDYKCGNTETKPWIAYDRSTTYGSSCSDVPLQPMPDKVGE